IGIAGILHAADDFRFVILALFGQFFHAFRVCGFLAREALVVSGLSAGAGAQAATAGREDGIGDFRGPARGGRLFATRRLLLGRDFFRRDLLLGDYFLFWTCRFLRGFLFAC